MGPRYGKWWNAVRLDVGGPESADSAGPLMRPARPIATAHKPGDVATRMTLQLVVAASVISTGTKSQPVVERRGVGGVVRYAQSRDPVAAEVSECFGPP